MLDETEHPFFNYSKGELKISRILNKLNLKYIKHPHFKDLVSWKRKSKLKYDFYLPDMNLCIEFDGRHHYYPMSDDIFNNLEKHFQTRTSDKIKEIYCRDNKIDLLRIPYWEGKNSLKILDSALSKDKSIRDTVLRISDGEDLYPELLVMPIKLFKFTSASPRRIKVG